MYLYTFFSERKINYMYIYFASPNWLLVTGDQSGKLLSGKVTRICCISYIIFSLSLSLLLPVDDNLLEGNDVLRGLQRYYNIISFYHLRTCPPFVWRYWRCYCEINLVSIIFIFIFSPTRSNYNILLLLLLFSLFLHLMEGRLWPTGSRLKYLMES